MAQAGRPIHRHAADDMARREYDAWSHVAPSKDPGAVTRASTTAETPKSAAAAPSSADADLPRSSREALPCGGSGERRGCSSRPMGTVRSRGGRFGAEGGRGVYGCTTAV